MRCVCTFVSVEGCWGSMGEPDCSTVGYNIVSQALLVKVYISCTFHDFQFQVLVDVVGISLMCIVLNWGHPLEYVTTDMGKNSRTKQKWFIICYAMQLVSTQQWGHHQAKNTNWRNEMYVKCLTGSRSVYIGCGTYRRCYMESGLVCRAVCWWVDRVVWVVVRVL
jgi:hypothetical protein